MKIRIAVIGYGLQGTWHSRQIVNSDVVELAGTYDIDCKKQDLAKERGLRTYSSFEEVLHDTSVDAIVIAVPNDVHKEMVIRSLEAGKHVICEKPVEMSVSAFDEMQQTAERTGKCFTVHQNRRWDTNYLAIKKLVESNEIGELISIESRIFGSRGIPKDWRSKKEHGGGMILDWGVHLIDQILQIIPEKIERVYCVNHHITNAEVDDGFKLLLYFQNGKTAHIEVGTYNFIALPRFYLQCKEGSALIQGWLDDMQVAKMKAWNEKDVLPLEGPAAITRTMAPRDEVTLERYQVKLPESNAHEFYRNFCKVIAGEEEFFVKPKEVRRVLQVMEAAFASDEKKQTVEVLI